MNEIVIKVLHNIAFEKEPNILQRNDDVISKYGTYSDNGWKWDHHQPVDIDDMLHIIKILHNEKTYNTALKISQIK